MRPKVQAEQARADGTHAVGAVVWRTDGAVLLVRRAHPPLAGRWTLPGGRVERGESAEDAIVREVKEETGLTVRAVRHLERVLLGGFVIDELECALGPGAPDTELRAGDDASDVRWADRADLAALGVNAEAIDVIERAFARR